MSREEALAKVGRLRAVTVERGATPAEAATAASLAQRILSQIAHLGNSDITAYAARHAPGVRVEIV
jgi:aryl-alcohol dehydrogenase-like predicted oxidoreductase